MLTDGERGGAEITQIGVAIGSGRRTHRDEDHIGIGDGLFIGSGEAQIARSFGHDLGKVRLIDGNVPLLQRLDLRLVGVETTDGVTEVSQADSGGQPHVARTDDGDVHSPIVRRGQVQ